MIAALLLAMVLAGAQQQASDDEAEQRPDWPTPSVYVARIVSAKELTDEPECQAGYRCSSFTVGYEIELEPVQAISGPSLESAHRVQYHAHSGFPSFAYYEHALVFEFALEGGPLLGGTGFPLALATDGRWVYCASGEEDEALVRMGHRARLAGRLHKLDATSALESDEFGFDATMPEGALECRHAVYAEQLAQRYATKVDPAMQRVTMWELPKAQHGEGQ